PGPGGHRGGRGGGGPSVDGGRRAEGGGRVRGPGRRGGRVVRRGGREVLVAVPGPRGRWGAGHGAVPSIDGRRQSTAALPVARCTMWPCVCASTSPGCGRRGSPPWPPPWPSSAWRCTRCPSRPTTRACGGG